MSQLQTGAQQQRALAAWCTEVETKANLPLHRVSRMLLVWAPRNAGAVREATRGGLSPKNLTCTASLLGTHGAPTVSSGAVATSGSGLWPERLLDHRHIALPRADLSISEVSATLSSESVSEGCVEPSSTQYTLFHINILQHPASSRCPKHPGTLGRE